jgi:hypothetical protein
MRLIVHVPAHQLPVRRRKRFPQVLGFHMPVRTGAIGESTVSFEGRLFFRRRSGRQFRMVHAGLRPNQPGAALRTVLCGILRPQKTIARDDEVAR